MINGTTNVGLSSFPDPYVDPKKKGKEWILQFAKAVWNSWSVTMPSGSMFYAKQIRYNEIKDYAQGNQSITKYKAELLADEESDDTWVNISWEPRRDGMVLRNIAAAILQKARYAIVATPINPDAKDAQDKEYNRLRIKTIMREELAKRDPNMAEHPSVRRLPNEPEDLEELEHEIQFSPKLVRAKDVEESVQLVFYEQGFNKLQDMCDEDLIDLGVAVVKVGLDENNKVTLRKVHPGNFGCSATRFSDFNDITWAFEIVAEKLSNLSKFFTEEEMNTIIPKSTAKYGTPSTFGMVNSDDRGYDIFKADVMELEFITFNTRVTEERKDTNGNIRISKANPSKAGKDTAGKKFNPKTVEVKYTCKWVMGTDLIYDWGIAKNQPRTVNLATMSRTKLSYLIEAANFNNMTAVGLTEAMIPIIDQLCSADFKLRNFRNRLVPAGFDIDLAAIESVPLGKGGKKMTPREVIDMFFETGILVSRRSGIGMDNNINYKAIQAIDNGMAEQLVILAQDIQQSKQALRDITGLNELTDGSTPDPKTLVAVANMAQQSTSNALYPYINARSKNIEKVARYVTTQLQIAVKNGPYDGYNPAAGKFITVPKSIADYDYDIMIEDAPTEQQRQVVYSLMQGDINNGYISHSEVIGIIYTQNLKQLAMSLAYKVDRGKKKLAEQAQQNATTTGQVQIASNAAAEKLKRQAEEEKHLHKMAEIDLQKAWEWLIQKEKNKEVDPTAEMKAHSEILKTAIIESQKEKLATMPEAQPAGPEGGGAPASMLA